MRFRKKTISGAVVGVLVAAAITLATPTAAPAATNLGGLDLSAYCKSEASSNKDLAYAEHSGSAYNWRCWSATGTIWTGYKWWSSSIDMNAACRWRYGAGAWASTNGSSAPTAWQCYR